MSNPHASEVRRWPWPDSLDALIAAPEHHKLLLENDSVRVLEVRIAPGEITRVHTHRWPSLVRTLSATDFIRRDGDGAILFDSRTSGSPPAVAWIPALPPHSVENVGERDSIVFLVEVKG